MNDNTDFNKKLNTLSTKKKIILLVCLLLILGALYYLAFTERILVYDRNGKNVCNETYKLGKLISPMCVENSNHPDYVRPTNIYDIQWNFTKD